MEETGSWSSKSLAATRRVARAKENPARQRGGAEEVRLWVKELIVFLPQIKPAGFELSPVTGHFSQPPSCKKDHFFQIISRSTALSGWFSILLKQKKLVNQL